MRRSALIANWLTSLIVWRGVITRRFNSPRQQLVVPDSLKQEVMRMSHDALAGGHYGFDKTLLRTRQKYFWINMHAVVKNREVLQALSTETGL